MRIARLGVPLLVLVSVLSGCGLRHQVVHVDPPTLRVNPQSAPTIALISVDDARAPVKDFNLSSSAQAANVGGVFRGGSGIAVDLDDGDVASKSREIIVQALRAVGYAVVDEPRPGSCELTASVTQFRVDMPFNFWRAASYSQQMVSDVTANFVLRSPSGEQRFRANGHGENVYQRVVKENWEVALNRAVAEFAKDLERKVVEGPSCG